MLSEFIYGGMDGVITTVAIIGGTLGAQIPSNYALILGASNVLADGFSMGISRYNSLINVQDKTNSDISRKSPFQSGLLTFIFFVLMGSIPLLPLVIFDHQSIDIMKYYLLIFAMASFIIIGTIKGIQNNKLFRSISETLIIGMIGALISFNVARYVKEHI
jgi:VIT1/CCC1 family predicted Fe2+/Mn2+ transporter